MANSHAQAQHWLSFMLTQDLPFTEALASQIREGKVGELCECGCHGFLFEVPLGANALPLQNGKGLFYELTFTSNFPEEINVLMFTDERGYLSWVDVTYGASNIGPMPEDIIPRMRIDAWPSEKG
jgi:hypothetical protein